MVENTSLYYYIRLYNPTTTENIGWYAVDKTTGYVYDNTNIPQYEYYIVTKNQISEDGQIENHYWVPKGASNDTTGTILKNKLNELNNASTVAVINIGKTGYVNNTGLGNVINLSNLCKNFTNLVQFNLINTTEGNVINTSNMFNGCEALRNIDFSSLNTSKVTDMSYMFNMCYLLTSIPTLNTSSCIDMNNMFNTCDAITNWSSVNSWNTTNVTNMSNMFYHCVTLTTMPTFSMSAVTDASYMYSESGLITIREIGRAHV